MYIVILDFENAKVVSFDISDKPNEIDSEDYVETILDYSLQNCQWMLVDEKPHIEFINL